MSATLDLSAVRRFTEDLNERLRQCDNGEGMMCSTLDKRITHYAQQCSELRAYINQWARAIFTGETAFDPAIEDLLKKEAWELLSRSKKLAALGRAIDGMCYMFQGLNALHGHIADFDYLLENWASPQRAVSPAPRVKLSPTVERQINERLGKLSAPPVD